MQMHMLVLLQGGGACQHCMRQETLAAVHDISTAQQHSINVQNGALKAHLLL